MAISNDWLADTWTLPLTVVTLHTRHGLLPELTRAFDILIAIPVGFEAPQVALLLPTLLLTFSDPESRDERRR